MSMFSLNHPREHGTRTDRGKEGDGTYTAIREGARLDDAMACGHVAAPWGAGHCGQGISEDIRLRERTPPARLRGKSIGRETFRSRTPPAN